MLATTSEQWKDTQEQMSTLVELLYGTDLPPAKGLVSDVPFQIHPLIRSSSTHAHQMLTVTVPRLSSTGTGGQGWEGHDRPMLV